MFPRQLSSYHIIVSRSRNAEVQAHGNENQAMKHVLSYWQETFSNCQKYADRSAIRVCNWSWTSLWQVQGSTDRVSASVCNCPGTGLQLVCNCHSAGLKLVCRCESTVCRYLPENKIHRQNFAHRVSCRQERNQMGEENQTFEKL